MHFKSRAGAGTGRPRRQMLEERFMSLTSPKASGNRGGLPSTCHTRLRGYDGTQAPLRPEDRATALILEGVPQ